jgi:hypothetical protein
MKKYNFIFSSHTVVITCLSFLSSYISLHYQFKLFADFLILGVIIAFPISFAVREAFRRREKTLEYLSLFKGTLQSLYFCFESSNLDQDKKFEIRNIITNTSRGLIQYLRDGSGDFSAIQQISGKIYAFIQQNEENLKRSFSAKILLFMFRTNESIAFLIAIKRHHTPWAIRLIILLGIYLFVILYPASLLYRTGFQVELWYVFVMTFFKAFLFICFYNIQDFLVDPFNQGGPDGVKLDDFEFVPLTGASALIDSESAADAEIEPAPVV